MMRTTTTRYLLAALVSATPLCAQGTISQLGFGYPSGQLSTRSLGTGGAMGDIDPLSATNPAVISYFGGSALYFQAEPEYRTLHIGAVSEKSSVARYPLVVAAFPVTPTVMLGLSLSNLLERSFETTTRSNASIGDTSLATTNRFKSDGAIGDVRVALAWNPRSWLKVGAAAHAVTGDNRVSTSQVFDDSSRFAALVDTATVGYTGKAFSTGVEVSGKAFSITGSYRRGGPLSIKRGDTTISNAHVPDRLAFSAAYTGIKGTTIAARRAKDTWSRMNLLGSSNVHITDGWDTSFGADILGPHLGQNPVQLRAGMRSRTLPFGLASTSVSEDSYSFGAGTLMARGRAAFDIAGIRATRKAGANLSETAFTLSIGVTVRP
ncbi:MAG: hypothetical protein V4550_13030 [Gemmatimonadota bacterium]